MGKSFSAAVSDANKEPIEFDLEGEKFEVARPLPGISLSELAGKAEMGGSAAYAGFLQFIEDVMTPDDYKRFRDTAQRLRIDLETLTEISGYILQEGTGRPKAPSGTSSDS